MINGYGAMSDDKPLRVYAFFIEVAIAFSFME